jgi:hypothetical protein
MMNRHNEGNMLSVDNEKLKNAPPWMNDGQYVMYCVKYQLIDKVNGKVVSLEQVDPHTLVLTDEMVRLVIFSAGKNDYKAFESEVCKDFDSSDLPHDDNDGVYAYCMGFKEELPDEVFEALRDGKLYIYFTA